MELQASCRCCGVKFSFLSHTPAPYMRCYCSICRKVAGGFAINIMGEWDSLQLEGRERPCEYRVLLPDGAAPGKLAPSSNACFFCGECGRHLYPREEAYTSWFYPFAGCVDSALPVCHVLLDSKAGWVAPHARRGDEEHDTVADLGFASELAHYAEYSGGPSTAETYGFARKLFGAAKAAPDGRGRALIVGGGKTPRGYPLLSIEAWHKANGAWVA